MTYLTGFHAIEEYIKSGREANALLVAHTGPRGKAIMALAKAKQIPIQRVGEHELDKISGEHRGLALEIDSTPDNRDWTIRGFIESLQEGQEALVVVLDNITDPHNYGAILRSCDQLGVNLVVVANRRSAKDAEVVARTSAGASAWVPLAVVSNLVRAVEDLKEAGFWVYGADMEGDPVYTKDLRGRTALVMGSEGHGISRLLREVCDGMVAIPSKGRIDSLNVSVATGILLYEVLRQRELR